jgi:RNA polymerase sigma-70 factor, ECF subfamily
MHLALWQSLEHFDGRCSLRTWTYRVAHNIAISKIIRRRAQPPLAGLDELERRTEAGAATRRLDRQLDMDRLIGLIHQLKPIDRQVMLLYLEGVDGREIAEVTGMSSANVATKIHRIKKILTMRFHQGERDGE